jgi:serine/threonine protein kinase
MWSVGCIFAELLGRKIFLPGQTGFDQLNLIIQKLGTPSEEDIAMVPSAKARQYLQRLPHYPRHSLSTRFPSASSEAIDLLEQLLLFEPTKRITVDDALRHPYLASLSAKTSLEQIGQYPPFDFSFDMRCKTLSEIKSAILEEVQIYQSIATAGLPSRLSSLHISDASNHRNGNDEDERVVDGLLHRHIQTHYKRTPFGYL